MMGQYDSVFVAEAPDDETIARIALLIEAQGNVRSETHRAFSEADFRKIVSGLPWQAFDGDSASARPARTCQGAGGFEIVKLRHACASVVIVLASAHRARLVAIGYLSTGNGVFLRCSRCVSRFFCCGSRSGADEFSHAAPFAPCCKIRSRRR